MELKIGEKIKLKRKQKGLTLKELAGDQVTPAQISAIENGKCNPSPKLLAYIADRLEVDIEQLTMSSEEIYRMKFEGIKEECERYLKEKDCGNVLEALSKADYIISYTTDEQRGYYYKVKGNLNFVEKNYTEAFNNYIKSMTYYLLSKEEFEEAELNIKIGDSLLYIEKPELAIGYYYNAENIAEKKDKELFVVVLGKIAKVQLLMDKTIEGQKYYNKLMDAYDKLDDKLKVKYVPKIKMLDGYTKLRGKTGDFGYKDFSEAFEKYKTAKDVIGMSDSKRFMAEALKMSGNYDKAVDEYYKAIELYNKEKSSMADDLYMDIMDIHILKKQYDRAIDLISMAEESALKNDNARSIINIFIKKFQVYFELKAFDKAEIFAFLALDYIQKSGDIKNEIKLYTMIASMYRKMGELESSIDYIIKAKSLLNTDEILQYDIY